jgi:hypothetical protein
MRLAVLSGIAIACTATALVAQAPAATPTDTPLTLIGCLQGDGSEKSPWVLARTVLPPPPGSFRGAGPGGGRGAGAPPAGRGDGRGAAPGGGAPAAGGAGAGRGPGAPPPPPPPPPQPPVDLRLTGIDLSPWRGMRIQVDGTLGPAGKGVGAAGLQEFKLTAARSAWGLCP